MFLTPGLLLGRDEVRPRAENVVGTDQSGRIVESASPSKSASGGSWRQYPLYGGEMTSIVIDPVDRTTVYVGSRGGGVFKTVDGGLSWQTARDGLTYLPIRSLAIHPADRDVLFAGTDFHGVWKSVDGGASWSESSVGLDEGMVVFNLKIDPQNPETVYCGLAGGVALSIGNVFRSENGGATWTVVNEGMVSDGGDFSNGVLSLALDSGSPQMLYAGTTYEGVFRTIDSGDNWQAINEGVPFLSNTDYRQGVSALAVDHHRGGRPLAVIGGDLFAHDDAQGWQQLSTSYGSLGFISSQLIVHPTNDQRLYAAGGGLNVSRDAGVTWQDLHTGCERVAVDPGVVDRLFCTHNARGDLVGGVHVSTDGGDIWSESLNGIAAVSILAVAVDPSDENRIYAGGDGYLYRSDDGGATWSRGVEDHGHGYFTDYLGRIEDIAVDPAHPEIVWVAAFSGLMRSTDFGATLERVDVGVAFVNCLAFTASAMYAGTSGAGVIVTADGGLTWQQSTDGFPTFGSRPCPVLSLAADPRDPLSIWAGTKFGGGGVRSTDGGLTWQVMGLTDHNFVDAVAVNPADSDDVLAGAGTWEGGIYRSRDGGVTWSEIVDGIALVHDFAFDPHNPGHVYAATDGYGVLRSTNGGDSWQDFSTGIFHPRLLSLAMTSQGSPRLIAGSLGSGLYWTALTVADRIRRPSGRRSP